ncbi:hypothetical protein [Myroides odoratus]|uniref:hypothetical protein n=1 Tax=Myroides odoratus TaxID=256 RepID=UPI0039AEF8E0
MKTRIKTRIKTSIGVFALSVLTLACGEKQKEVDTKAEAALEQVKQEMDQANTAPVVSTDQKYKKGDAVPSELVCMVNDAYMGKKQLEVEHEGKMYYGCCAMCQTRIPEDEGVRKAIDPFSLETVDKAEAYIVLIGDNGEIAYFKNEENYKQFAAAAQVN